MKIQSVGLDI